MFKGTPCESNVELKISTSKIAMIVKTKVKIRTIHIPIFFLDSAIFLEMLYLIEIETEKNIQIITICLDVKIIDYYLLLELFNLVH